ncbi:MAG: hypothetical protein ACTHJR_03910 [Sphingomonas sp.]|uniref:hypothetical protein n=1 Tax=Sphingomonas sp. TaxID=28214 RepID=UPI003F815DDE
MTDAVFIRIVADTSGVGAALDGMRSDLGELKSVVQAMADNFTQGFDGIRDAAARGAQAIDQFSASLRAAKPEEFASALNKATEAAVDHAKALRETAETSREGESGIAAFGGALGKAFEIGEKLFEAGKKVADIAVEMGKASEETTLLAEHLGLSTHQVQLLQAMSKATGVDFGKLAQSTATLGKNFSKSPEGFKKLGIDIKAGSDQMTILAAVADKFAKTADGPQKTTMAIKLMGKAGAEMVPLLNQGGAAIAGLTQKAEAYGAANDEAIDRGTKLGETVNEAQLAWAGMGNVLTDALAPVLTEIVSSFTNLVKACVESYKSGGIVATIFQVITDVVEEVGTQINALAGVFEALWDAVVDIVSALVHDIMDAFGVKTPDATKMAQLGLNLFKDAWNILKDSVVLVIEVLKGAIVGLIDVLTTMGKIAWDAFTLNWGAIEGDWSSGLARMKSHALSTAKEIKQTYQDLAKTIAAAMKGEGPPQGKTGGVKGVAKGDGDGGGGGTRKGGGGAAANDDLVQRLDNELKVKQTNWAMEQAAQGKAEAYSLQSVADYWKGILSRDDLSAKQRQQIQERYLAAAQQLDEKAFGKVLDGYADRIEAAKDNAAAVLEITKQEAEEVGKHYGRESDQYIAASKKVLAAQKAVNEEKKALAAESDAEVQRGLLSQIDEEEKAAESRQQLGLTSENKLLAQERVFEQQRYQIRHAALEKEQADMAKDPLHNPMAYQKLLNSIAQLDQQHQAKLTEIDRKAIQTRTQLERQAINQVASAWGSAIGKMVTLQQGFGATVKNMWQAVQQAIGDAIGKIIEDWLAKEITAFAIKHGLMSSENTAAIESEAAVAGASGTASMAAAPFPMNLTAPEFGMEMAAAAGAFAARTKAAGGWWNVPYDGALTELHKNEMVLPAWAAQPLRSMLGGGAPASAPVAANDSGGGGYHYHDHTARGLSEAQIIANRHAFAKAMKMAHREGKLGFSLPG